MDRRDRPVASMHSVFVPYGCSFLHIYIFSVAEYGWSPSPHEFQYLLIDAHDTSPSLHSSDLCPFGFSLRHAATIVFELFFPASEVCFRARELFLEEVFFCSLFWCKCVSVFSSIVFSRSAFSPGKILILLPKM